MASGRIRDPLGDHLLTSQNAATLVVDSQPAHFAEIRSMNPDLKNIVSTMKKAKTLDAPIIHSATDPRG